MLINVAQNVAIIEEHAFVNQGLNQIKLLVVPTAGLAVGGKFLEQGSFFFRDDVLAFRWIWNALVVVQKLVFEVIPFDGIQVILPALVQMVYERSRIVLWAKLRFPKVFVGRFEAEVKVETVAEDENYFAGLCHRFAILLGVVKVFFEFLFEVIVNLVVGI
jgi:hypothetical protein